MRKDVFQTIKILMPLAVMVIIGLFFGADAERRSPAIAGQKARPVEIADISATPADSAKVTLQVDGMSCSGCISTIKSSLAPVSGIQDIRVDVSGGKVEVMIDGRRIENADQIAGAITAGGYPARVVSVTDGTQIREENRQASLLAKSHVAAVGDWKIARRDFDMELGHARSRYASLYGDDIFDTPRGKTLLDRLKVQIVSSLIVEGIQLQEIDRAGYKVDPLRLEEAFQAFLKNRGLNFDQFTAQLNQSGYTYPYFMKKFENRFLINNYLEDTVFGEITNEIERQKRYSDWFANARLLAEVVYYDNDVKRLVENGGQGASSCGGCTSGQ